MNTCIMMIEEEGSSINSKRNRILNIIKEYQDELDKSSEISVNEYKEKSERAQSDLEHARTRMEIINAKNVLKNIQEKYNKKRNSAKEKQQKLEKILNEFISKLENL